jgi:hypothetical protein
MGREQAFLLGLLIGALLGAVSIGALVNLATKNFARVEWCERIAKSSAPQTFAECIPDEHEVPKP